jgi:hypothetical protein
MECLIKLDKLLIYKLQIIDIQQFNLIISFPVLVGRNCSSQKINYL